MHDVIRIAGIVMNHITATQIGIKLHNIVIEISRGKPVIVRTDAVERLPVNKIFARVEKQCGTNNTDI
jgi:hypothetical protein